MFSGDTREPCCLVRVPRVRAHLVRRGSGHEPRDAHARVHFRLGGALCRAEREVLHEAGEEEEEAVPGEDLPGAHPLPSPERQQPATGRSRDDALVAGVSSSVINS